MPSIYAERAGYGGLNRKEHKMVKAKIDDEVLVKGIVTDIDSDGFVYSVVIKDVYGDEREVGVNPEDVKILNPKGA